MKKTALLFTFVLMIVMSVTINSYSQPASRSVGRRAVPRGGRDRKTAQIVAPPEIAVIRNEILVRGTCPARIVAAMLDDGDVFVGWRNRNQADQWLGEGTFYTKRMQKGPSVYYTQEGFNRQKAKAFSEGRVLIAFENKFVIISKQGKIVRALTAFDNEEITDVSVTPLSGGKTMLMIPFSAVKIGSDEYSDRIGAYVVVR